MGHWCWCCGKSLPNEKFSGGGHRRHICRECVRMPADKRLAIEQQREISVFLEQSHITEKNKKRLKLLTASSDLKLAEQAQILLEVALFQPYKRRRLKNLVWSRPELLRRLREAELIPGIEYQRDFEDDLENEYYEDEVCDDDGIEWFVE